MSKRDLATTPKISVKIWRPIIEKLEKKLTTACLRRDAYLARVLEVELDHLDSEVSIPNSEQSYNFVAAKLDRLDRKLVSLALPPSLTSRLNEICERKRIVRDAFFNRLFLLLAAEPKVIDTLCFSGESSWRQQVWNEFKVDGPFFQNGFYPLNPDIDPFWPLRKAFELNTESDELLQHVDPISGKSVEVKGDLAGEIDLPERVYTVFFDQKIKGGPHDLIGLNCFVPDWRIPGHPTEKQHHEKLDELLSVLLDD